MAIGLRMGQQFSKKGDEGTGGALVQLWNGSTKYSNEFGDFKVKTVPASDPVFSAAYSSYFVPNIQWTGRNVYSTYAEYSYTFNKRTVNKNVLYLPIPNIEKFDTFYIGGSDMNATYTNAAYTSSKYIRFYYFLVKDSSTRQLVGVQIGNVSGYSYTMNSQNFRISGLTGAAELWIFGYDTSVDDSGVIERQVKTGNGTIQFGNRGASNVSIPQSTAGIWLAGSSLATETAEAKTY